ncbi:N-acetylmuramoyl-L-alanine amidase [Clostridium sp.]|uniref:N-acetylmuramoyl-L-alanine amidase n=1 Tax=Clostridium sp. TaxID=1506 RepID=UPI002FCC718A
MVCLTEVNGTEIKEDYIEINFTKGIDISKKYIVIHGIDIRKYKNINDYKIYVKTNDKAKESVHYIVSDNEIIKLLKDNNRALHIKDKVTKEINNSNSVSVSIGLRYGMDARKVFNNLIELVNKLRHEYNIPLKNIIRHYDVTGKRCPEELMNEFTWHKFKGSLCNLNITKRPIGIANIKEGFNSLIIRKEPSLESNIVVEVLAQENIYVYEDGEVWIKAVVEDINSMHLGYIKKNILNIERLTSEMLFKTSKRNTV